MSGKTEIGAQGLGLNPLLEKDPCPLPNWEEWKKKFEDAQEFWELNSLIFCGFNIATESEHMGPKETTVIDRYRYYLSLSDGWNKEHEYFKRSHKEDKAGHFEMGKDQNGFPVSRTLAGNRLFLAQKAFSVLCKHLFSVELMESSRGEFNHEWDIITSKALLPAIMSFFRTKPSEFPSENHVLIRNIGPWMHVKKSHNEKQCVQFLRNLARYVWKRNSVGVSAETRERLNASKLWLIEILAGIEELNLLREYDLELDDACMEKLGEIALRSSLYSLHDPVKKDRKVASIEEACYKGSQAGITLLWAEARRRAVGTLKNKFSNDKEYAG